MRRFFGKSTNRPSTGVGCGFRVTRPNRRSNKKAIPEGTAFKRGREGGKTQGRRCKTPFRQAERSDWTSRYLRKRVAIISIVWPLLLPMREALACPKLMLVPCGNNQVVLIV